MLNIWHFSALPYRLIILTENLHILWETYIKGGPSDLVTKILQKNPKKSSLYPQSLSIFIHKTPVVGNHLATREIRELLRPRSTPMGITVYFYEQLAQLYTGNTQKKVSNKASDEDTMENNYIFVMLSNLSVISHFDFPKMCCFFFFLISGAKSKNNLRGYIAFYRHTIKKCIFFNSMILRYWWFVLFFHVNFSDIYIFFLILWDAKNLDSHL